MKLKQTDNVILKTTLYKLDELYKLQTDVRNKQAIYILMTIIASINPTYSSLKSFLTNMPDQDQAERARIFLKYAVSLKVN